MPPNVEGTPTDRSQLSGERAALDENACPQEGKHTHTQNTYMIAGNGRKGEACGGGEGVSSRCSARPRFDRVLMMQSMPLLYYITGGICDPSSLNTRLRLLGYHTSDQYYQKKAKAKARNTKVPPPPPYPLPSSSNQQYLPLPALYPPPYARIRHFLCHRYPPWKLLEAVASSLRGGINHGAACECSRCGSRQTVNIPLHTTATKQTTRVKTILHSSKEQRERNK